MSEINEVNPEIMEWARVHYPGFVLDINNEARWELSKCPSREALALEEECAARPDVVEVFTVRATDWLVDCDYEEDDEPIMMECTPAECLVVRDRRLKVALMKHISFEA